MSSGLHAHKQYETLAKCTTFDFDELTKVTQILIVHYIMLQLSSLRCDGGNLIQIRPKQLCALDEIGPVQFFVRRAGKVAFNIELN